MELRPTGHLRPWLSGLRQDVRYAIRTLRRSPGFAGVAVLTLAVGIGATTAISSVVDSILLRPLPLADSDRLVRVLENIPRREAGLPPFQRGFTYQQFAEWRTRTTTLSDVLGVGSSIAIVKTGDGTERLWGSRISANAFSSLGVTAHLGRTFIPSDESDPNVVLLGFDTWRRSFRSDPAVVGKSVEFLSATGGRLVTVVGVLSPDFELPGNRGEFYTPLVFDEASKGFGRVALIARLREGVTLQAAIQEANVIGGAIVPPPPADAPPLTVPRFEPQYLKDLAIRDLRPALRLFLAAVAVVLLIVCANVANLLLARGTARQREMAVRCAIGASRARVVRQVLTESLVLSMAGGILGAALGAGGVALVKQLATVDAPGIFKLSLGTSILPRVNEVGIDWRILGIAFSAAVAASVAFGILPALHLSRTNYSQAMGLRGGGSTRGASRVRASLVVVQLAMATVLLVGAGLLVHSFGRLSKVNRGYDPSNVLAFQLVFPPDYPVARKVDTIDSLLVRLRATPDVQAAGFTRAGMLIGEQITLGTFVPQGRSLEEMRAHPVSPSLRPVSSGYLTAMGVPLLAGRDLETNDAAAAIPAIVVSRSVARQFGPGHSVGGVVTWHMTKQVPVELRVVGVVEDLRNTGPDRQPYPEVFIDYRTLLALQQRWGESPLYQSERSLGLASFAVRTRRDPESAIETVARIARAVDPNAGIDGLAALNQLVSNSVARPRFYAVMAAVFAGVAGILALIGVYGVLAYAVSQRTQEIGIRIALGAPRARVLGLVLRSGLGLTIAGVALGIAGAAAGTRALQSMLFGVTPLDPTTFAAVSIAFGLVAALACYVPARRATKVDPMVALRSE